MVLVERHAILAELTTLLEDSAQGNGRVAVLSGGIASGKTAVLRQFEECARQAGASLLRSSGAPNERTLRFGVIEQLFLGVPAIPETSAVLASLSESNRFDSDPSSTDRDEERLAREICVRLLDLSRTRPLAITVDDHQFTDSASVRVLTYLQHRIASSPIMLLLSQRVDEPSRLALQPLREPHTRCFAVAPLSLSGVEQFLSQRTSAADAARLAPWCHDLTGGNPLLLHGILDDIAANAGAAASGVGNPQAGDSFARAVLACLHRGGSHLVDTARALAVLSEFVTPSLLARFLDLRSSKVSGTLRALEVAGLTDGYRFRHAGTRKIVLDELSAEERAALNLRAAELLHQDGAAPSDIVGYLLAAGEAEEPWAVDVLQAAADHAVVYAEQVLALGDVEEAVRYLEFASQACGDERQRAALTSRLAWVQWLINPAAASRHHGPLQAALDKGLLGDREAMRLVRSLVWHGRELEAAQALDCVGGRADDTGQVDAYERELTQKWVTWCSPEVMARKDRAGVLTPPPLGRTPRTSGTDMRGGRAPGTAAALEGAERILQGARVLETPVAAVACALHELLVAEKTERAKYWCDELLRKAERYRATTWRAVLLDCRAAISLRLGDLADAERYARTALSLLSVQSWGVVIGSPLSHLVQATTMMGKLDEAAQHIDRAVPPAMVNTRYQLRYLTARGHFYLATDRPHAALVDFQAVGDLAVKWNLDDPATVAWRGDMAQALARIGRTDRARELIDAQLVLIGSGLARARGISLGILASLSDVKQRLAMLGEAADLLQEGGDRYQLARTFAELEQVWQIFGELERARLIRRRALQLAKRCEATWLYDRLSTNRDPLMSATPTREEPENMALLSEAEKRVATLAALGRTNREIGRRLHITVSTVEQHLTRVYRKLNIKRRTDLPVVMPVDIADTA
ncbi:AAA family ATPase [Saccharomonospora azurea]|uniref:AAA family ATPase n=1 Tax=Saccharomonospora azurea TaxID=40988 RepID=UPI0005691A87|nr:LuxR family transcriptional regulator [Saccharomonospora azurea]